jgi:hypothetical protein
MKKSLTIFQDKIKTPPPQGNHKNDYNNKANTSRDAVG